MLIIFSLIFFLSFTQLVLSVFTLSHARFCIHHFCWWDMRVLEDEGFKVKTIKETKFTKICSLKCRSLIQLFFCLFVFWRVSQLERKLSVKCCLRSYKALGNISYWQAPRSPGHSRGVCSRGDLAGQPLFQSHVSEDALLVGRSQKAPLSPTLLPLQEHYHRWAGGYELRTENAKVSLVMGFMSPAKS